MLLTEDVKQVLMLGAEKRIDETCSEWEVNEHSMVLRHWDNFIHLVSPRNIKAGAIKMWYREHNTPEDHSGWYIIQVAGGLNGPGKSSVYTQWLSKLLNFLEGKAKVHGAWLQKYEYDTPDDVFYADLGFHDWRSPEVYPEEYMCDAMLGQGLVASIHAGSGLAICRNDTGSLMGN